MNKLYFPQSCPFLRYPQDISRKILNFGASWPGFESGVRPLLMMMCWTSSAIFVCPNFFLCVKGTNGNPYFIETSVIN